jgi:hypothetical protein
MTWRERASWSTRVPAGTLGATTVGARSTAITRASITTGSIPSSAWGVRPLVPVRLPLPVSVSVRLSLRVPATLTQAGFAAGDHPRIGSPHDMKGWLILSWRSRLGLSSGWGL